MRESSGQWLIVLVALVLADTTRGQLRSAAQRIPDDGRYRGGSDGRYRGGNDGRYIPSNEGQYVHQDDGSRGRYSGGGGLYTGTPGRPSFIPVTPVTTPSPPVTTFAPVIITSPLRPQTPPPAPPPPPPASFVPVVVQPRIQPRVSSDGSSGGWQTLRQESDVRPDGYHYLYETENGILAEESGRVEREDEGLKAQGYYQYVGDDGQTYRVDYEAGPEGFIPRGDHIPKVPPEIVKLLAYLATVPPSN
ncbi:larval cuticle protein LCP-30 [Sergentomyia squamirostris]